MCYKYYDNKIKKSDNKNRVSDKMHKKTQSIYSFIMEHVLQGSQSISRVVQEEFGLTRQTVHHHLENMVKEGYLTSEGRTKAKRYKIKRPKFFKTFFISLVPGVSESEVWEKRLALYAKLMPENIRNICQYGFTEMMNNAIEHSQSKKIEVLFQYEGDQISMDVRDFGIGIFRKISQAMQLDNKRQAILELSKGKFTTDPEGHSGEGIFFTSRMFDKFWIVSDDLLFSHDQPENDWLIEIKKNKEIKGTWVMMEINQTSNRSTKEIFDKYSSVDDYGFTKTHVPVELAEHEGSKLISRSQARRLLARFDRFEEVFLDFSNVQMIGQAFADEIFRVFRQQHPDVKIVWSHANKDVEDMIQRALHHK